MAFSCWVMTAPLRSVCRPRSCSCADCRLAFLPPAVSGSHDLTDAVVVRVADVDRAVGGDRCAVRPVERSGASGTAVAVAALAATSRNRRDGSAADVDPADHVVLGIDDQQIAVAVDRQLLWLIEDGGEGRPVFTAIGPLPGARS